MTSAREAVAAHPRAADAPAPSAPLFIVGPLVCNIATVLASAVLISALEISALEIDALGDALVFGAIVGVGYLVAMTFHTATATPNRGDHHVYRWTKQREHRCARSTQPLVGCLPSWGSRS